MILKRHPDIKFIAATGSRKQKALILVHGLIRTYHSMKHLGKHLSQQGYDVYLYDYPSTKHSIKTHSENFLNMLNHIIKHHNHSTEKSISIITHSLGGIIARLSLSTLSKNKLTLFDKLILLTPPNQGSKLARLMIKTLPFLKYLIKPLHELGDDNKKFIYQIPTSQTIDIGIIAAKYDHAAPASTTRLEQQQDFIIIKDGHSFIMNNKKVRREIIYFLQHGKFSDTEDVRKFLD
jgi:esterase/lipase